MTLEIARLNRCALTYNNELEIQMFPDINFIEMPSYQILFTEPSFSFITQPRKGLLRPKFPIPSLLLEQKSKVSKGREREDYKNRAHVQLG
ncbi:MAG: hypothetical protein CL912_28240 [Deltaproteobacteria bacterium]|nr:hypothetical protein [Deltaproteobacteria bacterium]